MWPSFITSSTGKLRWLDLYSVRIGVTRTNVNISVIRVSHVGSVLRGAPSFTQHIFARRRHTCYSTSSHPTTRCTDHFTSHRTMLGTLNANFDRNINHGSISIAHSGLNGPGTLLSNHTLRVTRRLNIIRITLSVALAKSLTITGTVTVARSTQPGPGRRGIDAGGHMTRAFGRTHSILSRLRRLRGSTLARRLNSTSRSALKT